MQLALSIAPGRTLALSRRRTRSWLRRLAFKAFPRLTAYVVL